MKYENCLSMKGQCGPREQVILYNEVKNVCDQDTQLTYANPSLCRCLWSCTHNHNYLPALGHIV